MQKIEYNFVFFQEKADVNKLIQGDLNIRTDIRMYYGLLSDRSALIRFLHRCWFSPRVNRWVKVPFKKVWNAAYFKNQFREDRPICFVIDRVIKNYFDQTGYFDYLRRHFPDCKIIFLFKDRVEGTANPYYAQERLLLRKAVDLVLAYSLLDAVKYDFTFFPAYETRVPVQPLQQYSGIDLFYAGEAKDRVKLLQDICIRANKQGLTCYFYIYHAKEEEKIPIDGMVYSDQWMPFRELLERAGSARCMADVLQGGAAGFTSRFWHAVFYDKLLITNNPIAKYTKYYDSSCMQIIRDADEIDFSMLKKGIVPQYQYRNEFSAENFIFFLNELLVHGTSPEEYYKDWFDICGYKRYLGL